MPSIPEPAGSAWDPRSRLRRPSLLPARRRGIPTRAKAAILAAVAAVGWLGWRLQSRPIPARSASGPIRVSEEPVQVEGAPSAPIAWRYGSAELSIQPMATYSIGAMVVHTKSYWWGWQGDLSPLDLSLVWGDMVKPDYDRHIHYTQHFRYTLYVYDGQAPFDAGYVATHASNHHIVPASRNVLKALRRLGKKQLVALDGYLVNVEGTVKGNPVWWRTSLVRTDTGEGACELFYVTSVRIGDRVYE